MGGNALKEVITRRYQREEYLKLENIVINKIRKALPESRCDVVKAYRTKPSFGDIDIVIEDFNSKEKIESFFNSWGVKEVCKNGNVWSIHHEDFQVDLIFSKTKYYNSILDYFAYNDIGNLLGRIARRYGFKLGQKGLNYVLLNKTNLIQDINVTNDYSKALEFIGYDSNVFKKGFETINDMFNYVINSDSFDPSIFALENRNHDARTRDSKRPNYKLFLKYIENKKFPNVKEINKDEMLQHAFKVFPEFKEEYDNIFAQLKRKALIKGKMNGVKISNSTGLKDTDLGIFYHYLNSQSELIDNYEDFLLNANEDELQSFVSTLFDRFNGKDISYKTFTSISKIKEILKDNADCTVSMIQEVFNHKSLMLEAQQLNQPVCLTESKIYVFNINTFKSICKKYFHVDILSLSTIKDLKVNYNVSRYNIIKQAKDISEMLSVANEMRDKKQSQHNKKLEKSQEGNHFDVLINSDISNKQIIVIDVESNEKDHSILTEIGISILKNNVFTTRHFIINENKEFRNGKYVPDHMYDFNFGNSEILSLDDAIKETLIIAEQSDYIIGNHIREDIKAVHLKSNELNATVCDTSKMVGKAKEEFLTKALGVERSLKAMNIPYKNLHNAGNDAYYNLLCFQKCNNAITEKQKQNYNMKNNN